MIWDFDFIYISDIYFKMGKSNKRIVSIYRSQLGKIYIYVFFDFYNRYGNEK